MGLVARSHQDPLCEVFRLLRDLDKRINRLRSKSITVDQQSGTGADLTLNAGDGEIWVDQDDNTLHYRVNGNEYKLTGTLV